MINTKHINYIQNKKLKNSIKIIPKVKNPNCINPFFVLSINGTRGSGKTYAITQLVLNYI